MGFPSPAQDYVDAPLSLDELCIRRKAATYMMRADSTMLHAGIFKDAILVVDASQKAVHGSIVVAEVDGCRYIRRLHLYPQPGLERLDSGYIQLVDIQDDDTGGGVQIFGVVTFCVNDMCSGEFDDTPVM